MRAASWLAMLGSLSLLLACGTKSSGPDLGSGASSGSSGVGGSGGGASGDGNAGTGAVSEPGVLFIQEDEPGFSAVDGKIFPRQGSTSITGYTGTGFADGDPGVGKTISWGVKAQAAGSYSLAIRYAFGGTATNLRDARLLVNGALVADPVEFAYTNTWNDWQETGPLAVDLAEGSNFIQLSALEPSGLANIDYLKVLGDGITPDTPSFSLGVDQNDALGGTVSYAPVQDFYAQGSEITLSAEANPGFFFQSWSGDVTSAEPRHSFTIQGNTRVTALFLPEGTTADPALSGYASVQDDQGTPYLVTGGSLGSEVTATTLEELKSYLESPDPYVVGFEGLFEGVDNIHVASNKTVRGIGDSAHLKGIELQVNGSRNVIIQNLILSEVVADGSGVANDSVEITGGAKNIWIDHCEFYSDLLHGKDYYDGLLDIKDEASFITVSWSVFHDHFKASLISSGDEQIGDTVIRATYHHNYFHDCGSRLPSIRFGKAHVLNNYYENNSTGSCVNSRMGAVVRVEGNYFQSSKDAIGSWDSPLVGSWDVSDNVFNACTGSQPTTSTGVLVPPYSYQADAAADVPALVVAGAGVGRL